MSIAAPHILELAQTDWDVVVIGAGVAGSVAARQFASDGMTTLLVESRAFPRAKVCGGCLNSRAIQVLDQIGLGRLVRDLHGEAFDGISLKSGTSHAQISLPGGISVTRHTLDMALTLAASQAGAVLATETSAAVQSDADRHWRQVELKCRGLAAVIRAKIVVCADGLQRTSLHALTSMRTSHSKSSRVGIGVVIEPSLVPGSVIDRIPHQRITMIAERHGYIGLTWAEGGRLSVAGALDPQFLKRAGSPGAAANQILASHGIHFPEHSGWHGTPSLTVSPQKNAAERIFVIGDAAGYVEPFTGEGMAAAVEEAVSVTPLVCRAVNAWQSSLAEAWQNQHRRHFLKRQRVCRLAAAVLRSPCLTRMTMTAIRMFPQPADYLVGCITRPTLAIP